MRARSRVVVALLLGAVFFAGACAPKTAPIVTAPRFPDYPVLEIPADLAVPQAVRDLHEQGWRWLQSGDTGAARRSFGDALKRAPGFYPSAAGVGFAALADRQYKDAAQSFTAALDRNPKYLPALLGQVDAQLGLANDLAAIAALEGVLAVDPTRTNARSRLDVIRLRAAQGQIESAVRARAAGRLDEAQATLEAALGVSPASPIIVRELARVEMARGAFPAAEAHARRAVELDAGDAESHVVLADILESEGKLPEAADAYQRAIGLDPRPEWRAHADALRAKANDALLPAEFRSIPTAATVTRAQVAAMVGMRLKALVDSAPVRDSVVATDVRSHWAAAWILPVTRAGVMEVFANHTFQPGATVRRAELAGIVSQLLNLVAARRPQDAAAWRAARPAFADVPAAHASYAVAAAAVAAGAMTAPEGRFAPTQPASGADLVAAIARLEKLAGQ